MGASLRLDPDRRSPLASAAPADRETSLRRDAAPAKARATKAAAPDTATMTERPAISPAVFSLRHRHNLRTATTLFASGYCPLL
jgi:hypothetical protein